MLKKRYPFNHIFFKSLENFNVERFYYGFVGLASMATVLPYCFVATKTIESMKINSQRVYNCIWYKLLIEEQSEIRFLIQYTQRDREVRGFGLIPLSQHILLSVSSSFIQIFGKEF